MLRRILKTIRKCESYLEYAYTNFKYPEYKTEKIKNIEHQNHLTILHAGGMVKGQEYTNSLEALNYWYDKGYRFFELDFEWTSDSKLVLLHDWGDFYINLLHKEPKSVTVKEFKKLKMNNNLTQLTISDLSDWIEINSDVVIITDIKTNNIMGLKKIKQKYPQIIKNIIPQIYYIREYPIVKRLGFRCLST